MSLDVSFPRYTLSNLLVDKRDVSLQFCFAHFYCLPRLLFLFRGPSKGIYEIDINPQKANSSGNPTVLVAWLAGARPT
jgi:hypothetical protein